MEVKDVVNKALKAKLKEAGFKTKGMDWWKPIDGGYLMVHHKKSVANNGANGFHSEVLIFAIADYELTESVKEIWLSYQIDNITLRDLVPEYGYFTEGMTNHYFDIDLYTKCPMSGKEYTGDDWVNIVGDIFDSYLIPFLEKVKSCNEFEVCKSELTKKRYSKSLGIYSFFLCSMRSGMFENNIPGYVESFRNGMYSLEEANNHLELTDRFLNLYSENYRKRYETSIRKFIEEVLKQAQEKLE